MLQTRQLAAIMFTDIVSYTALMGKDEQKAFEFLVKNRALHKPIIEEFNGRWIKELGDGVMASFNTVSDAVNAAIKIQEGCNAAKDYQLRIGIHQGEVVFENEDIFGDAVNIAARIQAAAKPGCIYVSESVHHNITNKKDIQSSFVKEETLKNVKEPVRIYEVNTATDAETFTEIKEQTIIQEENSIAVLPFANMSSDPEQEFFSDGISEEIINMLAQVPNLKVAGRTSAFSFKGKNQDLRSVGTQLNVNHILEGSVRKSGNKLRITAQLIKVSDGYHLWSEKYDRELEDIFDIQDEIALAILEVIKIKLLSEAKKAVLKKYTDNIEAYQLYLQGLFHVNKMALDKAIESYQAAIAIEPDYAIAYAGIAKCYGWLWHFNILPPEQCLPQMIEAGKHSLHLDKGSAESHTVVANAKIYYEKDVKAAILEFETAIELNPNYADGHIYYAQCLVIMDKITDSFAHAMIAQRLEPFSLIINLQVGSIYWMAGFHEKAIEQGKKLIELEPNFYGGYHILGLVYVSINRLEEALVQMELAAKLLNIATILGSLGLIHGLMGEKNKAMEMSENMENLRKTQWASDTNFAQIYLGLGEYDTAYRYFEQAIDKKEAEVLFCKYYLTFPQMGLAKDPRTEQLLKRLGLA
ncbi:adenylate/guanylate cyclase domain-containing protein [Emticicia sp. SJ17W-69]|uniref:adenylate/guanylate cyclase domain-containing protein n=1 Tax=Emticicia sp. SJ17W-69 TaxID=3421657 RepID=UPI003EB98601